MRSIKAIVYGVGTVGKLATRYMVEKGVEIVGAIGHVSNLGRDLGEVAGLGYELDVRIRSDADRVLNEHRADIALVSIATDTERMDPIYQKCIQSGLNVITASEEALYAWKIHPESASRLDKLARRHEVTIIGSGFQDAVRVNLVALLSGTVHKIESITGKQMANIALWGPEVLEPYHLGKTREEFYSHIRNQGLKPSSFRASMEALIADLGLTIRRWRDDIIEPTFDEEDIFVGSLGRVVPQGRVSGQIRSFQAETEEGIAFRGSRIAKVFTRRELAEGSIVEWSIKGVPDLHVRIDATARVELTCAQLVNRIPDVINSEPGYVTVEKLPKMKYRAFPLHYYLKR